MNSELNADNLNAGHRQRLFNRFSASGFSGMAEHEILELILFSAIPRRDVKPLAKKLLLVLSLRYWMQRRTSCLTLPGLVNGRWLN